MRLTSSSGQNWLEKAVVVHASVLVVASACVFGGNIWWMRTALTIWAGLAFPLAFLGFARNHRARGSSGKALWLVPPALYAALVIASTFNPSFGVAIIEDSSLMIHRGAAHPGWPSTVKAADSWRSLAFGAGAYLAAFNVALIIKSRSAIRHLMTLTASLVLGLSVFGTLQKLSGTGFYLGAIASPNVRYFSTFIYNNHWGAFMILGLATAMGLLFYHARLQQGRDLWHSPFSAALLGVLLIAATGPLSASRAATGMASALVIVATAHALLKISASRRRHSRSAWPMISLVLAFVLVSTAAVGWLGFKSINARYVETRNVLATDRSIWGERASLYKDTWDLALQQPVFGWGLDSYSIAFQLIRPRPIQPYRQYESSYATAHNDWLQSVAETGFVGTALLIATLALPLGALRRPVLGHPLVCYPLLGIGVVLLYAGFEFPFANGALLITFCVLFFSIIRYAELTDSASRPAHE